MAQISFPLGGFASQDMARECFVTLDFTGTCFAEPFGGAFICLHLRHNFFFRSVFKNILNQLNE